MKSKHPLRGLAVPRKDITEKGRRVQRTVNHEHDSNPTEKNVWRLALRKFAQVQ